jgi:NAD(P)-dependent dehydrogenase (short-subunit alcohol dehydrogenase family)
MMQQGEGAIVLIGSGAGLHGCPTAIAYGAAKGSIPQLTRALARELADSNVRVNCVSPGVIRTPFQNRLAPEQVQININSRIPLHREGQSEDVANAIVGLLENEFIMGDNLVIDGGMTMRMV